MTQLLLDATLPERIRKTRDLVEIVDDAGHVVGMFCPIVPTPYDPSWIPPISDEERKRRRSQPGVYSTEEVLQHLESL